MAAIPPLVLLGWVITGQRGPSRLELPRGHVVDTSTVMAGTALALTCALVCCALTRWSGLALLGVVLVGIAGFWPIVQENKFAGPVVVSDGTHGLHRNDILALVPGVAAIMALRRAVQCHRTATRDVAAADLDA